MRSFSQGVVNVTSIYQSNQPVTNKGIGILCYLYDPDKHFPDDDAIEPYQCEVCHKTHPQLYRFFRKPAGIMGHWVGFRINGSLEFPDLSIPMYFKIGTLPRDAVKFSNTESSKEWHS